MSNIRIKSDNLSRAGRMIPNSRIREITRSVNSIRGQIDWKIAAKANYDSALKKLVDEMEHQIQAVDRLSDYLSEAAGLYDRTECDLFKKLTGEDLPIIVTISASIPDNDQPSDSSLGDKLSGFAFGTIDALLGGGTNELKSKYSVDIDDDDYKKKWGGDPKYYKDGKKISEEDTHSFYDRELTILEGKHQVKKSKSIFESGYKDDVLDASVKVGNAEGYYELSAGLYVIGADGKKKFSPGVKAEIGGSVSLFESEIKEQVLGDENFGLNTKLKTTVGKVEGKAGVTGQFFGEDGKLDVQLNGKVSAEVIGGEIEGTIGVNVLGGEVAVKGGINYGVGAHAEVGYKDGVFKCDVGASLGLGFSLDFEVNVGGMIDGAKSVFNDVGNGIKNFFGKIF